MAETTYDAEARIPIAVAERFLKEHPADYTRGPNGWIHGPAFPGERATTWHGLMAFGGAILRAEVRDDISREQVRSRRAFKKAAK